MRLLASLRREIHVYIDQLLAEIINLIRDASNISQVLRDPERQGHLLLKRIARAPDGCIPGPAQVYVLGDNAGASRDSRAFGFIDRRQIVGRAWLVY